ncbi:MAG: DUF4388 domain-containing protein [Myxococcales bacterium]|nr:DUF4388 domain-containing protein [Myxococcales bacterium]
MAYALRFIAGKFKGGEFPLKPNREVVIGRGSEFDMVLDEDMVSRRHAKIATFHGQIVLQDLKSTNGTFVNGERTTVARLKVGDKVLVGTSVMEVIRADEEAPSASAEQTTRQTTPTRPPATVAGVPPPTLQDTVARPTIDRSQGMSGRFPDDVDSVADLVELFNANRRTGVLVLTDPGDVEGRMFFRDGQVYYATLAYPNRRQAAPVAPLKCFNRLLTWQTGEFRLDNLNPPPSFDDEMEGETRSLLMDGLRQWDELKVYAGHLPSREARLALVKPLRARLSGLSAEALDTLQVVLNYDEVGAVLDYSPASDLETAQDVLYLLQNEYLTLVEPES